MPAVSRPVKWMVALAAGAGWALRRLVHTTPFYDEWTLIGHVVRMSPWEGAFTSFNGHLWMFQDALYRAQVSWFGADSHWLVVAMFVVVLIGLHTSFALLAQAAGLPLWTALVGGFVVAYPGRGSQDFVFAVQVSPMASLAMVLAACRLVLVRDATRGKLLWLGGLALLSVVTESGLGAVGMVMVAVLVALRWGARRLVVLGPAAAVLGLWLVLADGGPRFPASLVQRARVAGDLLLHGAGALVGKGMITGSVLLALSAVVVLWLRRLGAWTRADAALALAGAAGAIAAAAVVAQSRAGLPDLDLADSNRYIHFVAVPFAVALLGIGGAAVRVERRVGVLAPLVLLVGVAASLPAESAYSTRFIETNRDVHTAVRATTVLVAEGCPSGAAPTPSARPAGPKSPQVTVALVADLMARGHLSRSDVAVSDDLLRTVCPNG